MKTLKADKCKWQDPSCKMTNTFIDKEMEKKFTDQFWASTQGYNNKRNEVIESFIRDSEKRLLQEIKERMENVPKYDLSKNGIDGEFYLKRAEVLKVLDSFNK